MGERSGSVAKFWLRGRDWREKQGPDTSPPPLPLPHPLTHPAFTPGMCHTFRGWCLKAHETPSSPVQLAEPPGMIPAKPVGWPYFCLFHQFVKNA